MQSHRRHSYKIAFPHVALAIIIAGALLLRVWNIRQGLWWDEIWSTMKYAQAESWWYTISKLGFYFNNHVFYSILCRCSISLLGTSELTARLPALVMGLVTIPVLYRFARKHTGHLPALLATLLLALSAFHIDHSTEARGYSGLLLFSLLATLFFFNGLAGGKARQWVYFTLFTFLGFYCHMFMAQVPLSQLLCCFVLLAEQRLRNDGRQLIHPGTMRRLVLSLAAGACLTITAYAPMLKYYLSNAGKVRLVGADRMPFVCTMLDTMLPGFTTLPGMLLYSLLFACGLLYLRKRSAALFFYTIIICNVPLLLYLLLNPMFIFKRYFIPFLPFCLLTIGCGIEWIAQKCHLRGPGKAAYVAAVLVCILLLQWPAIRRITTESRQHYREAVQYIETHAGAPQPVICSIGHAGWHFNYYAKEQVSIPKTFEEFKKLVDSSDEVWCLITAWLPDIRPPHEDELLFSEDPEHEKIFNYVQKHFTLQKHYSAKFPTYVYRSPGARKIPRTQAP